MRMREELNNLFNVDVVRKKEKHPDGWKPGLTIGARVGSITTEPMQQVPDDWNSILAELLPDGFSVDEFEVDDTTIEVRAWDANVGGGETKRLYYFRAKIRRRVLPESANIEDLISAARRFKKRDFKNPEIERTYCLQITDLQAGQADGDGIAGLTSRALKIPDLVADDLKMLKRAGKPVSKIFIAVTGDLVEGISGWYEMQTFSVTLDRREQVKLVRRLLSEIFLNVASHGIPVHIATVPGNHGENRSNGKAYTSLNDNDDVALVEQIAEAFTFGNLEHVTFAFPPKDRLSLTVEVDGHVFGLTHGHVARSAGTPAAKILNWFKSMSASRDPIGDADLLITGHYHHLIFQQLIGDTWLLQGGALCDASAWFSQTAGLVSDPIVNKWTTTNDQLVELLMPYTWSRSRIEAREIE